MDWNATTLWWLVAGVLVAAELATGTFYLLMLALGAASAALTGHLGGSVSAQSLLAAAVAGGATTVWHLRQRRAPRSAAEADPTINPDIGRSVQVDAWGHDGTARVQYRGAAWSARFAGPGAPAPGAHVIVAVQGSQLQVSPDVRS